MGEMGGKRRIERVGVGLRTRMNALATLMHPAVPFQAEAEYVRVVCLFASHETGPCFLVLTPRRTCADCLLARLPHRPFLRYLWCWDKYAGFKLFSDEVN
jgi:hypothetical protein